MAHVVSLHDSACLYRSSAEIIGGVEEEVGKEEWKKESRERRRGDARFFSSSYKRENRKKRSKKKGKSENGKKGRGLLCKNPHCPMYLLTSLLLYLLTYLLACLLTWQLTELSFQAPQVHIYIYMHVKQGIR